MSKNSRDTTTGLDHTLYFSVQKMLEVLCAYMDQMVSPQEHLELTCHSTCRALAFYFRELRLVDGLYLGYSEEVENGQLVCTRHGCQHSWLVTPDGGIIDPCPVATSGSGVLLIIGKGVYAPYGAGLYKEDPKVTLEIADEELERKSQFLIELIRKAHPAPT